MYTQIYTPQRADTAYIGDSNRHIRSHHRQVLDAVKNGTEHKPALRREA